MAIKSAWCGDSRAVMSKDGGYTVQDLSTDHKPEDPREQQRILKHYDSLHGARSFRRLGDGDDGHGSGHGSGHGKAVQVEHIRLTLG